MKYTELLEVIHGKKVELRHDVDISLLSAYKMSKLEYDVGVKSIYYLRFDSDYYNLLTYENMKIVNYLMSEHEVGCHVDSSNFDNTDELYDYLYDFNKIIPFKKFTFHINTDKTKKFGEIRYFQNKSILKNEYISDSKNNFTFEKFNQVKAQEGDFTLCIHPEWWDSKDFTFNPNGVETLIKILQLDNIKNKALKEILKYE